MSRPSILTLNLVLCLVAAACSKNATESAGTASTANAGTAAAPQVEKTQPSAAAPNAAEEKPAASDDKIPEKPIVELVTSMGSIRLELFPAKAPKTVANFLRYVRSGHYAGTVFHRVISTFMIQGGGFDKDLQEKPTTAPIMNEADNGLSNQRGTIAMARTPNPHSAGAQFFINVVDNPNLDFKSKSVEGWGYCVFGKVALGMDVVNKIKAVPTGGRGQFPTDVPQTDVVIKEAKLLN